MLEKGAFSMTTAELTEALDNSECECLSEEGEAFERLLNAELRSLASIEAANQQWLDGLGAGMIQFSFQFDKEITQRYRKWVVNARLCLQQLELQETKDCHPSSAREFRRSLEAAEDTLLLRTQDEVAAIAAFQDAE